MNGPEIVGLPSLIAAKLIGAKTVYDVRSTSSLNIAEKFGRGLLFGLDYLLAKNLPNKADVVITPILQYAQENPEWVLMPQAIDTSAFKSGSPTSRNRRIILCVSSLTPKEGIDTLIKSMAYISDNVELWIIGNGPEKSKLQTLARQDPRIKFLGHIVHSAIPDYLSQASVCVFAARGVTVHKYASYTSVLKIGEYLAAQKPIVSSNLEAMIPAREFGVVFAESNNPQDFAEKIKEQLKNPTPTKTPIEIRYDYVKQRYLNIIQHLGFRVL
ncbi:MAG: glycosyltransferase family 4 protein [Candidatus Heimdallarchaeota archaeon]